MNAYLVLELTLHYVFGVSPSGKAVDFDSAIRRFESCHPSNLELNTNLYQGKRKRWKQKYNS